jgi:hypothetical protein
LARAKRQQIRAEIVVLTPTQRHELADLIRTLLHGDAGAKSIAADLDKAYFTLMAEISALEPAGDETPRNKLGLVTLVEILDLVADPRPFMDWLAARYRMVAVPRPTGKPGHDALLRILAHVTSAEGALANDVAKATDPQATDALRADESKQIETDVRLAMGLLQELAMGVRPTN